MMVDKSIKLMQEAFSKTRYNYQILPELKIRDEFGIYVHVPFCYSKCDFCPFYKEIYSEELVVKYMKAIINEIQKKDISGKAKWLYIGGGTPNTLTIEDIALIINTLKSKVEIESIGIELLPSILTFEKIKMLKDIGINKISLGIESLSEEVLKLSSRKPCKSSTIEEMIDYSKSIQLFVNVDLMVGLPDQNKELFINDIHRMSKYKPSQITIYPFMIIGEDKIKSDMSSEEQFNLIEEAWSILKGVGYERAGIWTFVLENDVYDSSRDELVGNYIGFGAAAFSVYDKYKMVNPELNVYIENSDKNCFCGLVAEKDKSSDSWRKFSRMVYDLKTNNEPLPVYLKMYLRMLRLSGYIKNDTFTQKGIMFAHSITKTVVENLPYPLQNTHYISNYDEYKKCCENTLI